MPITDELALEEVKLQTGLSPVKFYRSSKTPSSGTFILAVPEDHAKLVPTWIHLFGTDVRTKVKPPKPRVELCPRCWGFHNPRTCTRSTRCHICGGRDHTEQSHPPTQGPRCTNCCGLFPASHPDCPAKPIVQRGAIQRLSRNQLNAIRRTGMYQYQEKAQLHNVGPRTALDPSQTTDRLQNDR